jgi:hypothetical protein
VTPRQRPDRAVREAAVLNAKALGNAAVLRDHLHAALQD